MSDYSSACPNHEEINSAREEYDEERGLMSASVTLRCAYTDRHTLAGDICGHLRAWPKGAAGLVPLARGASIVPAANMSGNVTVGEQLLPFDALVTVHYTTKNQEVVTESYEPYTEFITDDYRLFAWSGSGRPLREDEAPGQQVRGINFVRNELFVLPPLPAALIDLVGSVNQAPYFSTFMNRLFGPETLLYFPPSLNRKFSSIGDVKYDITKKFGVKPQGWNTYWNAQDQAWERIVYLRTGAPYDSYPLADLSPVLPTPG